MLRDRQDFLSEPHYPVLTEAEVLRFRRGSSGIIITEQTTMRGSAGLTVSVSHELEISSAGVFGSGSLRGLLSRRLL